MGCWCLTFAANLMGSCACILGVSSCGRDENRQMLVETLRLVAIAKVTTSRTPNCHIRVPPTEIEFFAGGESCGRPVGSAGKMGERQNTMRCTVFMICISLACAGCAAPMTAPAAPGAGAAAGAAGAGAAGAGAAGAAGGAAAAAPAKATLPQFLGLGQAAHGIGKIVTHLQSHLGSFFPGLEPKPPILPITAAGGEGASPAVAAAAEIKAEEDKAAQKIKAIRYLAGLGCVSCYTGIEEAFLAALEDCTEEVRYEAVKGLRKAAGNPCKVCRSSSCCTPKLVEKLEEIANKMDGQGCYTEPSPRVRRLARLTLSQCGGAIFVPPEEPTPEEGPSGDTVKEPPAAPAESSAAAESQEQVGSSVKSSTADAPVQLGTQPNGITRIPQHEHSPAKVNYGVSTRKTGIDRIQTMLLEPAEGMLSAPQPFMQESPGRPFSTAPNPR